MQKLAQNGTFRGHEIMHESTFFVVIRVKYKVANIPIILHN